MIRESCVNGLFYKGCKELLVENIESMFDKVDDDSLYEDSDIKSIIVPHAGYIYSGQTASYGFKNLLVNDMCDTIVVVGPNHRGLGTSPVALSPSEKWNTPMGDIDVDVEFNDALCEVDANVNYDEAAHLKEHSVEVEVPFIQYVAEKRNVDVKLVPIVVSHQEKDICIKLARSIYEVAKKQDKKVIVVASTDLTHYEDSKQAEYLDGKVLDSIRNLDSSQLINEIIDYDITMCGYGPTITAMEYALLEDASNSIILDYSNSGHVYNEYDSVVGYAAAMITK